MEFVKSIINDFILFPSCLFILIGSVYISFKMGFVQVRLLPNLLKMLGKSLAHRKGDEGAHTLLPHHALFTAMSTTLGIGTIVGPVIAIHLGGPGALLGFLLCSFFGSAATFTEVSLCIQSRKKLPSGQVMGGPMHYLKVILGPSAATWYALCCMVLMTAWSGAQANQLVAIWDSPLLGDYRIPTVISGALVALLAVTVLIGGIKNIGALSSKLVPLMFVLYLGSSLWIISSNLDRFWATCIEIVQSAFSPYAMASGTLVGGLINALRWGIFKGTQATEAGVGTQTIPHSMASTEDSVAQGTLAMLSTYSAGAISFLSGCVTLMTQTWQDPELPLGISMVAESFRLYFSSLGVVVVAVSALLFAFGTILGNSYNGSQCFAYLTDNRHMRYYYIATAVVIFAGSVLAVETVWSVIDILLAFLVLPHMAALVLHAYRNPDPSFSVVKTPTKEREALFD